MVAAVGWDGRDVSGLSHEQIHRWTREGASPEALAAARDHHLARADELRTTAERLRAAHRGVAETWIGRDADAAGRRTGTLASRMEQLAEAVSGQARGVEGMRAALVRVQAAVGPPRPPALPSLGAPPVLGELRALVTGAPADGFPAFRAAAHEQAAAREAYRSYLTETAAAARGVPTAGEGPPAPTASGPGAGPAPVASGPTPGRAAAAGSPAPAGADLPSATRGALPATGARGASTGVLQRAAAAPPAPAPPGDLPVGARAVGAGPVPGGSAGPGAPGSAGVPAAVPDRGPAPSASGPPAPGLSPAAGPSDAGRVTTGAPASGSADGGVRAVPFPTTGTSARRPGARRRGEGSRTGSPQHPATDAGTPPAAAPPPAPPAGAPPASTGHADASDAGGHGHPAPGPLDAAPFGLAPVTGGPGEHRLPPRRTEYLVDPDPAGWGADTGRRVAPPVLGETRDAADPADGGDPAEPS